MIDLLLQMQSETDFPGYEGIDIKRGDMSELVERVAAVSPKLRYLLFLVSYWTVARKEKMVLWAARPRHQELITLVSTLQICLLTWLIADIHAC